MHDLLSVKDVDKSFPGVHALKKVSLSIRKGEVHALVGENGAGKSTLMNILSGIQQKDSGSILFDGKEMDVSRPLDSQLLGISIIHQELNLVPHFSIAENMFVGREKRRGHRLPQPAEDQRGRAGAAAAGGPGRSIPGPWSRSSASRSGSSSRWPRPWPSARSSSSWTSPPPRSPRPRSSACSDIIRELRSGGRLGGLHLAQAEEVFSIADRITVIRDGEVVRTVDRSECTQHDLIQMMVGAAHHRDLSEAGQRDR